MFSLAIALACCSVIAVPEDVAGQRSRTSDETDVGVDDKRRPAKEGKSKKGGANGGKDKKNKKSKDKDKDSANGGNRKSKGDSVKPGKEVKTKSAKREGGNEVKKNKGALRSTSVCTPNDFQ